MQLSKKCGLIIAQCNMIKANAADEEFTEENRGIAALRLANYDSWWQGRVSKASASYVMMWG